MPMTELLASDFLNWLFGGTSFVIGGDTVAARTGSMYLGLGAAPTWGTSPITASVAVTSGQFAVGTAFNSGNRHVFVCTTSGTLGALEPTWNQSSGQTTPDGTAVWTECSNLFDAGSDLSGVSGCEPTIGTNAYARVSVAPGSTNWNTAALPGGVPPEQVTNKVAFNFPSPTNTGWGQAVLAFLADATSAGRILAWTLLTSAVTCGGGSAPSFAAGALAYSLT